MSEAKHTPGPWKVCTQQFANGQLSIRVTSTTGGVVALMKHSGGCKTANARLIAAAPEGLAFAERVVREHADALQRAKDGDHQDIAAFYALNSIIRDAQDFIAKATPAPRTDALRKAGM